MSSHKNKEDLMKASVVLLGRPSNNLKMGIVGLPNVGKSTFFNALTSSSVAAENYPFCTINPSENKVAVPDDRFNWLCKLYSPVSKVPAYLTVIDIAGLVRGASKGDGLGNAFLSHIKAVDGIFHMVRTFVDESIEHVEGDVNPIRDMEIIHEELRLKDVEFLTKQMEIAKRNLRSNEQDKVKKLEHDTIVKALEALSVHNKDVRHLFWTTKEIEFINTLQLLTAKSVVYLANMTQEEYIKKRNKWLPKMKEWIDQKAPGDLLIPFSAAFEGSLMAIDKNGISEVNKNDTTATDQSTKSALPKIIVTGYQALQLQYFFTAGEDEVRAWTIRQGTKAPQAAGVIHTDFERGFIAAEVMSFEDLKVNGSENAAKASGKYMTKGKEYVVSDGDVIFFKFNVTSSGKKK